MMSLSQFQTMQSELLLGIVNQQLRDEFSHLEDLCSYHGIEVSQLHRKLNDAGFYYLEQAKQYRAGSQ